MLDRIIIPHPNRYITAPYHPSLISSPNTLIYNKCIAPRTRLTLETPTKSPKKEIEEEEEEEEEEETRQKTAKQNPPSASKVE